MRGNTRNLFVLFVVLFIAALGFASPASASEAECSFAKQDDVKGGFDMIEVARNCWGYEDTYNDGGDWDNWYMSGSGKTTLRLGQEDFDRLCHDVYGKDYYADHGKDSGSVKCVTDVVADATPTHPPKVPKSSGGVKVCPNSPSSIMVGITHGRSTLGGAPLRVRDSAGGAIIGSLRNGEEFDIIDPEPGCAEKRVFWNIQNDRIEGWVMEGDYSSQYIEPWGEQDQAEEEDDSPTPTPNPDFVCKGKPEARLSIGSVAVIIRDEPLKLRKRFESGDFFKTYPEGTTFTVIEGPKCGTHNVWYRVKVEDGKTGWFPEGRLDSTQKYWVEPVESEEEIPDDNETEEQWSFNMKMNMVA